MPPAGEKDAPLIVLLGPTAVGKTALSIALARALDGEIVSADSRLVYRGMDIGVAKPSAAEQRLVPHHLLDLVSPAESLSLADYQRAAYQAIAEIHCRSHLPLLVGGTGQYITAVVEGWRIPEVLPNPELRARLEAEAGTFGPQALWERLQQHDPEAAARIHPNNIRRVVRALEVFLESGIPISELQRKAPPPYRVLQVGLWRTKRNLYARIDSRLQQMLADGLVEEVRRLLAAGYDRHSPAMSGLGYRQIADYLVGDLSLEAAVEAVRRATYDFARRQDVWFRKYNRDAHWFEMTETTTATIIEFVQNWLESPSHAPNTRYIQRDSQ